MSFTDQQRRICSEQEASSKWGLDQHSLYCTLCGHIFEVGDGWRWVYANDGGGGHGNFEVCDGCDGPDVLKRYRAACKRIDELARPYPDARWEIVLASKLSAAESLVRDLAKHLRELRVEICEIHNRVDLTQRVNALMRIGVALTIVDQALSRVPKELLP